MHYLTVLKIILNFSALAFITTSTTTLAQDYPNKPIRLVVPTIPGGATDFTARYLSQRLALQLKQTVLIDNRAGAGGNIGLEYTAKAPADGYTLVMPITSFSANPSLYDKLPFDTVKDFDPIAMVSKAPLILVVNAQFPANSVDELIAYAKANPGKLNYGHSGSGTMSNLASQLFKRTANIEVTPIGYKGAGQIMTDLISGQIQFYFSTIPAAIQLVNTGRLKVLGVSSSARVPELSTIRTIAESGLPGFEVVSWFAIFGPAGMPKSIVDGLNHEILKVLSLQETRETFAREGLIIGSGSPQDLKQFLISDIAKWKKLIADAGIRPE